MEENQFNSPVNDKQYNVNAYAPRGGLVLAADGRLYDLAALLGASADDSVSDKRYNINTYAPRSGLVVGADGRLYDLVALIKGIGGSGTGQDDVTPHIGDNGHWYLGDTDTGVAAQGPVGPQGNPGYTPVRGVDYWTADDQAAMDAAVMSASAAANSASAAAEAKTSVESMVERIAKEPTAQEILSIMQQELALLKQMVDEGISGGDLNGFSFALGKRGELVISYVNPEDDTDTAIATFATKTQAQEIAQTLSSTNEVLRSMAGVKATQGTEV